jgi:hypothetical protein
MRCTDFEMLDAVDIGSAAKHTLRSIFADFLQPAFVDVLQQWDRIIGVFRRL